MSTKMSFLPSIFDTDIVLYQCSCGNKKCLPRIYFCRHCLKLRCRDCLSHEVDSQYCQHCLEYIPTIDAKLKKNKCSSCFSCPECEHTLLPRVYLQSVKGESDAVVQKKHFYLSCYFCRWTSRDVNIPDQQTGTGGWPDQETPNASRISGVVDFYRKLAQKEKTEKDKKRLNPRSGNAIHLLDKYGISAVLSPKVTESLRAKYYMKPQAPGSSSTLADPSVDAAIATNEVEDLAVDYEKLNSITDLGLVSTIDQRLHQIETQPMMVSSFHPMSQMLSVKRSLRCKECDHNLSKPEYNPSSIKFKILLAAYNHVPEIKISSVPNFEVGKETLIEFTIQNPTPYKLNVTITPGDETQTCKLNFNDINFTIQAKDETLDLDIGAGGEKSQVKESSAIKWKKGNKVAFNVPVTPLDTTERLKLCLSLKHDFVNSVIQIQGSEKMETQISWVTHHVSVAIPEK